MYRSTGNVIFNDKFQDFTCANFCVVQAKEMFSETTLTSGRTENGDGITAGQGQRGEPVEQRLLSGSSQSDSPGVSDKSFYVFSSDALDLDDGKENEPPQSQKHDRRISLIR
ncbi:hypothetical protein EDD21DRAFT_351060 [Dissophora ornata]|nr:hypothetical protein EDD21DRAFT_351060 [Dissophora ornata]